MAGILLGFTVTGTLVVSPQTCSPNEMFNQHPVWNRELLFVGGFLARAVYELEMQDIAARWDASVTSKPGEPLDSGTQKQFYDEAGHDLQFFTFRQSTPSAVVSSEIRSVFFNCGIQGQPFPIISSAGVKPALDVRAPDPILSTFPRKIPIFPEELLDGSRLMVVALREEGLLKDITFQDVLNELWERLLSEEETAACLQWWINTSWQGLVGVEQQQLLGAMQLTINSLGNGNKQIIPLKGIQTFLNPQQAFLNPEQTFINPQQTFLNPQQTFLNPRQIFLNPRQTFLNLQELVISPHTVLNPQAFSNLQDVLPMDGPLPSHLLPISISQKFSSAQLQKSFHWRRLTILDWVQHIVDPAVYAQRIEFNIVESPFWAEHVFQVLSSCWLTLQRDKKTIIAKLFKELTCIPTSAGMKMPSKAYFPDASIFSDLPIVNFPSGVQFGGVLKSVLVWLGVQESVDLEVICSL